MVLPLFSDGAPAGGGGHGRARRDAHEQALLRRQLATHRERVLVGDGDHLVVHRGVQRVGHEARADALDLVRARAPLGQHRRRGRLYGHNLHVGVHALEVRARAAHRAARAHARHEDIHVAARGLPDLRARGSLVDGRVRRVRELSNDERVGDLGRQLLGACDGAFHAQRAVGQHQLGAVGLHEVATLDGHRLGHGYDQAHAARGGDGGQADAGVARRRLDEHGVGVYLAGRQRVVDHRLSDAVLDGAGRIERLHLPHDDSVQVVVLLVVRQLHQRRAADQLRYAFVHGHDVPAFPSSDRAPRGRRPMPARGGFPMCRTKSYCITMY